MNWADGPLVGFDIETTGTDVETARIVTATVVRVAPGEPVEPITWLADPGVEIPEEATAIHRITTEHARAHGEPAELVVHSVANTLHSWWGQGAPVVGFNVSYDFTVLDREMRRYGLGEFTVAGPVLDPYVIDRGVDRYRKGKRQLGDMCQQYNVELTDAHSSAADAVAAVAVMRRIADWYLAEVDEKSLRDLWTAQRGWYRDWAVNFEQYLRRSKAFDGASAEEIAAVRIDRDWPIRPYPVAVEEVA